MTQGIVVGGPYDGMNVEKCLKEIVSSGKRCAVERSGLMESRAKVEFVVVRKAKYDKDGLERRKEEQLFRAYLSREEADGTLELAMNSDTIVVGPEPTREDVMRLDEVHAKTAGVPGAELEVSILAVKFPCAV